ncbi:MAG TPA: sodium/solute symporter [Thermoleophilaceae bacterium]|jgi:cation/acetate symporter
MTALPVAAEVRALPIVVFGVILAITLGVTYWASRRTSSASQFWAAGRGITAPQNGLAIAGDYMSAAAFLGVSGLIFLYGFDGYITGIAALVSFIPVLLLLAERLRNAGKYTMADMLAYRLNSRPARSAAALGTIFVVAFYLVAQMIAAGALIEALAGISFNIAVLITGGTMLVYVIFGGMLATTWVQIIKAVFLLTSVTVLAVWALGKVSFNLSELFSRAADASGQGDKYLGPGLFLIKPMDVVSTGLAFALGTAGLPHILMRFFTVPDARAARRSAGWAVLFIGVFYVLVMIVGLGSRALLGPSGDKLVGEGGNLAAPYLAQTLGGGAGSAGGDIFFAIVSAAAFATILAVVAGLVMAASGAVAHDVWANVIRRGRDKEGEELRVARIAASGVGVVAIALAILAGKDFNIQFLVGLAFSVAASANFPALLLSISWRRFNTAGAITGVLFGLVTSLTLIVLSPAVWPGPDSHGSPFPLSNPAVVSIPAGFIGCFLGTLFSSAEDRVFDELRVKSDTGLGAEEASPSAA